jgi:hypothetical protein
MDYARCLLNVLSEAATAKVEFLGDEKKAIIQEKYIEILGTPDNVPEYKLAIFFIDSKQKQQFKRYSINPMFNSREKLKKYSFGLRELFYKTEHEGYPFVVYEPPVLANPSMEMYAELHKLSYVAWSDFVAKGSVEPYIERKKIDELTKSFSQPKVAPEAETKKRKSSEDSDHEDDKQSEEEEEYKSKPEDSASDGEEEKPKKKAKKQKAATKKRSSASKSKTSKGRR